MTGAKKNILGAIGNTPIVKLNKVTTGVASEIYVKLEFMNPGGSSKDRIGGDAGISKIGSAKIIEARRIQIVIDWCIFKFTFTNINT